MRLTQVDSHPRRRNDLARGCLVGIVSDRGLDGLLVLQPPRVVGATREHAEQDDESEPAFDHDPAPGEKRGGNLVYPDSRDFAVFDGTLEEILKNRIPRQAGESSLIQVSDMREIKGHWSDEEGGARRERDDRKAPGGQRQPSSRNPRGGPRRA
jgi:hypothetical protein